MLQKNEISLSLDFNTLKMPALPKRHFIFLTLFLNFDSIKLLSIMKKQITLLGILLAFVIIGKTQITAYPDTSICPGDEVTLGTSLVDFCGDCYSYQELEYAPEPIGGLAVTMVDDTYIGPYDVGFDFCFFGETYTEFYLCSNGWISFVEPGGSWAGNWTPDGPIPDAAGDVPKTAIFSPWTDWHTGLCEECIHFENAGVAPNRKLIITWDEVPLFSCTDDIGTFQIILRETSNFIDNHFTDVMVCPTWDIGVSTQGLQNQNGTIAFTVEDRNATAWEAHDESWRWYTSLVAWYDEDGVLIGEGQTVDVSPEFTETYTVVQTLCDGTVYTDDVTVEVGADFEVDLVSTNITCGGDGDGSVSITITGGLEPYTYEWSTGETGVTELTDLDGGTYSVTVTEAGGCQRTYEFTIIEPATLEGTAEDIINNPCNAYTDGYVHIVPTGGTIPYTFSLDGGDPTIVGEFSDLPAGEYNVTITDASGCTFEVPFSITEPILLTADATADDQTIFVGQTATITVETSLADIVTATWEPEVPCLDDPCLTTTVAPTTTTTYTITVVNSEGCIAVDTITIFVEFVPEVFFPSAFSPNSDGTNDLFQSIGYNITTYHLKIFNRWGEIIFETDTYDASSGWDGKFEGEEQDMGTYVWQVSAGFINGEEYIDSGNFVLVR